jgi:hypothetical protein
MEEYDDMSFLSSRSARGSRRAGYWRGIAVCAAACALLAACSSATGSITRGSGSGGTADTGGSTGTSLTPSTAIKHAAAAMQDVTSVAGTVSIQASGVAAFPAAGTVQIQLKPSLLAEEHVTVNLTDNTQDLQQIISGTTLYWNGTGGSQWNEVPLSSSETQLQQISLSSLLPDMLYSILLGQTQALTASANVDAAGTQVINGVSTTHYQGALPPSAIGTLQPAAFGQAFSTDVGTLSGSIGWDVWLDSQGDVRQIELTMTVPGHPGSTTYDGTVTVTSINQPLTVAVPPASQVQVGS